MKRIKLTNKQRFACFIVCVLLVAIFAGVAVDFIRFPECYISTWKYQLKLDIAAGDAAAVEYYESNYVANGRALF